MAPDQRGGRPSTAAAGAAIGAAVLVSVAGLVALVFVVSSNPWLPFICAARLRVAAPAGWRSVRDVCAC
jgi:type IV secretory pathway VirB3-like protein